MRSYHNRPKHPAKTHRAPNRTTRSQDEKDESFMNKDFIKPIVLLGGFGVIALAVGYFSQ